MTNDDADDWFPHISPDGKTMAFLSYDRGVGEHPANRDVRIRVMDLRTHQSDVLARLFGGQGTINVNSWSPDSQSLAFVSYQIVPDQTHR
jgi:Tol biopolymer transport system component